MIKITNLTKAFNNKAVFKNVSLEIGKSAVTGIYGENGSGKSTFLRLLATVYAPDSGNVSFEGRSIFSPGNYLKDCSLVTSQTRNLYERLTGYQNINFLKNIYDADFPDSQLVEYAKRIRIYESLPRQVSEYSLGMKQKLSLLVSVLRNTRLLFLDEAFDHLDTNSVNFFTEYLSANKKERYIIFVSKNKSLLEGFCDTIYEIADFGII